MERVTVAADAEVLDRLRGLARERHVSFAVVVREALAAKAAEYRPRPLSIGSGESSRIAKARHDAKERIPPRSWRDPR